MKNFYFLSFLASTLFALSVAHLPGALTRFPAALQSEPFELTIQSVGLDAASKLPSLDYVYVRAIINDKDIYEFGKNDPVTVGRGEKRPVDYKLEMKDSWIKDDALEFRLEIVRNTTISPVIVRCATISKALSTYNRSYQCNIPGESTTPVLVYRLARRGSLPVVPIASNQ